MKFRIDFTVRAETLFSMMAKMLPIEDLHVEEVFERPTSSPVLRAVRQEVKKFPKPKPKAKQDRRKRGLRLDAGINAIVLGIMSDGKPHRAVEVEAPVKAAGYSSNSVVSRMQALREAGIVFQPELGLWQITQKRETSQHE